MAAKQAIVTARRRARMRSGTRIGDDHVTDIQRRRMISATIEVVAELGRPNANVAHIVARSGVSRRTFYEIFDGFEDCFSSALEDSLERAREYVLATYEPHVRWRRRMRSALVGLLEFLEDEPSMGRLCIVETLGAGPRVHERRTRVIDALIAMVDEGRDEVRSSAGPAPMTAEGVVGGVLSVLHSRLIEPKPEPLLTLAGPLMSMIVLAYLGPRAAQAENSKAVSRRARDRPAPVANNDPLRDLEMRLTYRTVRVLMAISAHPGASNREVGHAAGIEDQGQTSKLLGRLQRLGLIGNFGTERARGTPNAWTLTDRGVELEALLSARNPMVTVR